jgi:hypothetical protein
MIKTKAYNDEGERDPVCFQDRVAKISLDQPLERNLLRHQLLYAKRMEHGQEFCKSTACLNQHRCLQMMSLLLDPLFAGAEVHLANGKEG